MKSLAVIAAAGLAFAAPSLMAQTCASPSATIATAPFDGSGGTCASTREFDQVCGGGMPIQGPTNVWQVEVGPGNDFDATVTPTTPAYNPAIFFIGPGCGAAASCAEMDDANGAGAPETISMAGLAPGTYYIVVTSMEAGAEGCGDYTLHVTETLPVELQSFSID